MPRHWLIGGLWIACAAAIGCQGSHSSGPPTGQEETADGQSSGQGAGGKAVKPPLPILEGVDAYEGSWLLAPSIERASRAFWLFRLSQDEEGRWRIADIANEASLGKISGKQVQIDGNKIRIKAELDNPNAPVKHAPFDFEGTLEAGVVWGNLQIADAPAPLSARLFPTDADSLADYSVDLAEAGDAEFQKAQGEPDPAHRLWEAARNYPNSPLAVDVYHLLFSKMSQWKFTEDEVQAAAADLKKSAGRWGPRMQAAVEVEAGLGLAGVRKFVDVAEEFLDDAERLQPERSDALNAKLKAGRIHVRIARGLLAIQGDDEEAAAAANQDLQELLAEQPYHPEVLYALAEYAERHDQIDAAIDAYATLVALPALESMAVSSRLGTPAPDQMPHAALERLWKQKHGSLDDLPSALAAIYDRETSNVLQTLRDKAPKLPDADAGNRVALVELFTGTSCAPCVAVDLALRGLMRDLPDSEAVLLSYHQHVPGPDPLASMDGEGRAKYYKVEATPTLFMNGAPIPQIGGVFLPMFVEQNFIKLHPAFEYFLKLSTDVAIDAKAEADGKNLNVKVAATGIPDDVIEKVRLRIALAENDVDYFAPNGLRHHRMVVRMMLGTPSGKKAAKDGSLEFKIAMPLAQIKGQQVAYLTQFEQGKRMKFPDKPLVMKPLHLVAFVQNDTTHEVLQASSVAVTGEWEYPPMEILPNGQIHLKEEDAATDAKANETDGAESPGESEPPM